MGSYWCSQGSDATSVPFCTKHTVRFYHEFTRDTMSVLTLMMLCVDIELHTCQNNRQHNQCKKILTGKL